MKAGELAEVLGRFADAGGVGHQLYGAVRREDLED